MKIIRGRMGVAVCLGIAFFGGLAGLHARAAAAAPSRTHQEGDDDVRERAERLIEEGRRTFRHDTFGDEAFWGGALRLHEAIEGAAFFDVEQGVLAGRPVAGDRPGDIAVDHRWTTPSID